MSHESVLDAALKAEGIDERASIATLDSIATSWANDLSLSLGCIGSDRVMYAFPYSFEVPPSIDTLTVGIWNYKTDTWVEGEPQHYRNPVITDDGSGIYIASNAQVRQILGTLNRVDRDQDPDLILTVGIYDSTKDTKGGWGEFAHTGLRDALRYLPCY